ncbi:MAG: hypothetical protein ACD_30C00040G0006 [uncultured bacterium]|uniref:Zn-dependent hydrolase of the beta-lactamase fold-like protein n=4 Tax=Candidatus Daviesiibacteriota TaxID=1752718 RepID=A0A0G0EL48_9BACT|nr:MAG: hypothetical protein ACD_30C00040G0006 [uncultured bacterium]KKQ07758.1 MAG: Zn-dependent hydrolase of the beta-lactamase fold-like protein [Candidatus Daviesbacteria bacterium GW2011_GWB1_36_5]KKQ15062.1 MAG: Zn-dependent hydrolase of the beta-lactamase fold-like protein [Candidatus Daviesbacteria bacterium GW2011_GWA1_36_8]OGE17134.1 MAG: hypothetical protein A2858_00310 [Candidatus Daviesbacteria bacterium RIFCSPHIGHO2_01_FULL_36_37]OGE35915.1 MAG: hypothetical protein A3E66_01305 [C
MDIIWFGQAMFKLKGKQTQAIIDPFYSEFTGLKLPKPSELIADLALKTHDHEDHSNLKAIEGNSVKIEGPGEYEVKGVAVTGVSVFHDSKNGEERGRNTVYNIEIDGVSVLHLGDLGHTLTQEQLEEIGPVDIVLIPVGGTYTIDAPVAAQVVSQLEPKIVIPMHFKIDGLKFPLDGVDLFLKEMGVGSIEPQNKFSITKDKLPDETQVIVLNKV